MLDDSLHEHQELKEKYKLLQKKIKEYQFISDEMLKTLELLTDQYNLACKYIKSLEDLNAALLSRS